MSTTRKFTWQELSALNQMHNAHVAVRGKVYDISKFINHHPGGPEILQMAAGKDITIVFESYHIFSSLAPKMLEKYYVGDLISSETPTFPELGAFYKTLRERVRKHFSETKKDPKNSPWIWLRHITIPLIVILMWCAQMFWLSHSFVLSAVAAAIMGLFCAMLALHHLHDGSHFSVSRNPRVWRILGHICELFTGISYYVWMHKHILSHHPYTNIHAFDPDVDINTSSPETDIRRIKWRQKLQSRYYYQHIYTVPLYFTGIWMLRLEDIGILFLYKKTSSTQVNAPSKSHLVLFVLCKLFCFLYRMVIPAMILGFWRMIPLFFISEMVGGAWIITVLEITHIIGEVDWPEPDKDGKMNRDWAEHQVATTQDFATDSWLLAYFAGTINHQVAHHLFPEINQIYYPQITPIVRETCKEFGIKYRCVDTIFDSLGCHIRYLKKMGRTFGGPPDVIHED
ncbi:uncharacterized protein [Montipora foliosa]|uniref:uncharacterized protein isoform X2 n=1 Tax=Montipora foliosa TaxID=591990 RepID=UPI0035F194EE